jgi:predicted MFS family arabinose efflux permease
MSDERTQTGFNLTGRMFLLLVKILAAMAFTALLPVLPAIEAEFRDTPGAAALTRGLISSLSIAMILGSLIAGPLGGQFGIRRVLLVSLIVYALAGVAGGLANDLGTLLATRLVLGLASAIIGALVLTLAARGFADAVRDKWMGWLAAAATIGSLVAVPLGGALGSFGWRYVFLVYFFALPLVLLLVAGIPADRPADRGSARVRDRDGERLPAVAWKLAPLAMGIGAIVNAAPLFIPFHLAETGATLPSMIALAMLANAFAGVVISLLYGRVRRWLSIPHIFALSLFVGAGGLLFVSQSQSYALILFALAVTGLGLGLMVPNLFAMAASLGTPAQTGKIIGLTIACLYAGGPALQFGLEAIVGKAPAWTFLTIVAGLSVLLGLIWLAAAPIFRNRAAPALQAAL